MNDDVTHFLGSVPPVLAVFGRLDWAVVGAYFALVTGLGIWIGRRGMARQARAGGGGGDATGEYFLAGRNLPAWVVSVSIVATMLSAATFVGVPDIAFKGDLTYLSQNLGGFIAVFVVALVFVPRLYAAGTVTIYGFLAQRYGESARLAVSLTFIFGRMLASGARLFLAALPLCLLMFGTTEPAKWQMVLAIFLVGAVGTFYTLKGGVRAVVWVDALQLLIVVGTALLSIGLLLHRIPISVSEIWALLGSTPTSTGSTKTTLLNYSTDPKLSFTVWSGLIGGTFMGVATMGVDQDLAQRFLITKSARKGAWSVIGSQFISVAVVSLFLAIGLLLWVFYQKVEAPKPVSGASVYPWFLLHELPTGLSGLSIVGFFAIAQGSLDSAINALASSVVADVIVPWRAARGGTVNAAGEKASKATVGLVGAVLIAFAMVCALTYDPKNKTLLDFALGVMSFALTGMLGVFLTALLTKRGSASSVIAALVAGFVTVTLLQDSVLGWWSSRLLGETWKLAWPWWMTIGSIISFAVCVAGNRPATGEAKAHGFQI